MTAAARSQTGEGQQRKRGCGGLRDGSGRRRILNILYGNFSRPCSKL